jgi:hypothetical protein
MHRRLLQRRMENALATLTVSLTLLEREVCLPHDPRPPTRLPRPAPRCTLNAIVRAAPVQAA